MFNKIPVKQGCLEGERTEWWLELPIPESQIFFRMEGSKQELVVSKSRGFCSAGLGRLTP